MKIKNRLSASAGFTLVEILVTMVVSLVVLLATMQLFETSQKSYLVQEEVAETQQNVRIAKMFLERDIRMAGTKMANFSYAGEDVYPFEFENNITGTVLNSYAKDIVNAGNTIVAGTDLLVVRYFNFNSKDCGDDSTGTISDSCDDLPQLLLDPGEVAGSTEMRVNSTTGWGNNCYCDTTTMTTFTPANGRPFFIEGFDKDGPKSAVFFQTGTGVNKLQIGPITVDGEYYGNNDPGVNFPVNSTISFIHPEDGIYRAIYSVQLQDGIPCLVRDTGAGAQVIAEYIEDMQLSFALDTNDDGVVDDNVDSDDLTNTQKRQVRMVTLNLIGRSPNPHRNFSGQRPALEDRAAGAKDSFRRRQMTVNIQVRNLGLPSGY